MRKIYAQLVILFSLLPTLLFGQDVDIHFSQFFHAPLFQNPALTGIFQEDLRLAAYHRRQWQTVPVPYLTFAAAADTKLPVRIGDKAFLSAGITLFHDEAGDAALAVTSVNLHGSAAVALNEFHVLSVGFSAGGGQRSLDDSRLRWGSQFDGEIFNPDQLPGEMLEQTNRGFVDVSGGVNWHIQRPDGLSLDVGAGIFHLNQPAIHFLGQEEKAWDMRISTYAMGLIPVHPLWRIRAHASAQFQGPKREILAGAGFLYQLNREAGRELALGAHFTTRLGDALIPTVEVQYRQWTAGLSFDLNTSDFREVTNGNGGPELVLIYKLTRVKPVGVFESCPIF